MSANSPNESGDILIIDDAPDTLRFLSDLLSKAGYTVRKVLSGELGIEAAQLEPPDLILLDIKMPGISGYEVCDRLRWNEKTRSIPVIFLSALNEEVEKVMAFQSGAVDYITKPFHVVEVLARIEIHLRVSRLQRQLQQQNAQLQQAVEQRSVAESAFQQLNQELEIKIRERTAELEASQQLLLDLQAQLQAALTHEQQISDLKSRLISSLARGLRTPLTVMTTATERLQTDLAASPHHHYLKILTEGVKQMSRVLQDALLLADVSPQELPFNPVPLDLTSFCQSLVNQWRLPETPFYQLTFTSHGQPVTPILADEMLLQRIISQLLSNAIRYSPFGGSVKLEVIYQATQVLIRVQDKGIGIPPKEIDRIFERFYQASNAEPFTGTSAAGLGLAMVKQAVERHNGTVTVESQLKQGTTFTVTLPLGSPH
ncbi:MAG: hybrid sensor histidine kinase/response regulator [Synechococcales cyanobacterium M58_A2018_015]|nr:hybrid sensor histidine kinase/response regulator [Synechococcales cyanobacterium M58_A2018_015]